MPPEPWSWTKVAVEPRVPEAWAGEMSEEPWKVGCTETVLCSVSVGSFFVSELRRSNLCLAASSPKALWAELEVGHQAKLVGGRWAIVGKDVWSIGLTCFRPHR